MRHKGNVARDRPFKLHDQGAVDDNREPIKADFVAWAGDVLDIEGLENSPRPGRRFTAKPARWLGWARKAYDRQV